MIKQRARATAVECVRATARVAPTIHGGGRATARVAPTIHEAPTMAWR
jgi:hypothetical protein